MRPMRWLPVLLSLAVASCATTPKPADDVVAGQLLVGTEAGTPVEALPAVLAVEGYTFRVVSSATDLTHLVQVEKAEGTALNADETRAVLEKVSGRKGVRFVELNRVRQPR